ncbi:hypothetical protein [Ktedonobacter sp. SOSP1-85]|uniref:hypothetical protein n=1 Tax=Ktedonobacter sp. SOSP1-85 TaxID=2778367 RepID=UPI001914DACE|nr:hypothetical protein [Ktedonobacter sp. SOSP1-85]
MLDLTLCQRPTALCSSCPLGMSGLVSSIVAANWFGHALKYLRDETRWARGQWPIKHLKKRDSGDKDREGRLNKLQGYRRSEFSIVADGAWSINFNRSHTIG